MKKTVLFIAACLLTGAMTAQTAVTAQQGYSYEEQDLLPLSPTYLDNVFENSGWNANWFLSVKGGMSAFVGKPVGHGDIFDRTKPMLNVGLGKWFTPSVGGRLAYQGLYLIDSDMESRAYQSVHADFLYNIMPHFQKGGSQLPRWDIIPYLGCGIIRNSYNHHKPFAISYGLMAQYRLTDRLHASAEIGGTTTWQDFDGHGKVNRPGDNLLQAGIGLSLTIGKVGWKQVIDPKPYLFQNDLLSEHIGRMKEENGLLNKLHKKDEMALVEMRKILEIEGLLDKYELTQSDTQETKAQPRNNYSGLNSLRARLRNKAWNGDEENYQPMLAEKVVDLNDNDSAIVADPGKYFQMMKDGKIFVGTPIFFFFKLSTDELTEKAQLINIKEVASTIKKYGLCARVVGAADSQTGTAYGNERLSAKRADYIARILQSNGVPKSRITTQYRGGINTYEPQEGNRNTCVMLYFKE